MTATTAATEENSSSSFPSSSLPSSLSSALDAAALVFLDGRLAEAALPLADAARSRGVPVLEEAERPRDGLAELLERATFVATSASFPGAALCGEAGTLKNSSGSSSEEEKSSLFPSPSPPPHPGAAAAWLLASLPASVKWVSTTLGDRGAILLERRTEEKDPAAAAAEDAASAVDAALSAAEEARRRRKEGSEFAARSSTGAEVGLPGVVSFRKRLKLPREPANPSSSDAISVTLYASTAASLPSAVVDSTGAGDAFNGAHI